MSLLSFWLILLVVMFVYMTSWYAVARVTRRADVVDSAWGLGFIVVAWLSLGLRTNFGIVAVVSAVLVSVWGFRLFLHLARRNWRRSEDDHRYQELRIKWGKSADRKLYTNVFLLQGVLILLVSLPMLAIALQEKVGLNAAIVVGWCIWVFGIFFEAVADWQLARFLTRRPIGNHQIMQSGLWRYSRHPNYFGEVVTWWGGAIVAISTGAWWGVFGAVIITLLITKVSGIPPLEKHYAENPQYTDYKKRTSVLLPLPPRRS